MERDNNLLHFQPYSLHRLLFVPFPRPSLCRTLHLAFFCVGVRSPFCTQHPNPTSGLLSRTDSLGLGPRRSLHTGPPPRPRTLTSSPCPHAAGPASRRSRPPLYSVTGWCTPLHGPARPTVTLPLRHSTSPGSPHLDSAQMTSESPRSRYSGPGRAASRPHPDSDNTADPSQCYCCRLRATVLPQVADCGRARTAPVGRSCECRRSDNMDPPTLCASPLAPQAGQPVSARRSHCLVTRAVCTSNQRCLHVNGTATPAAVLGGDLSGSIPVGSAFNTQGTCLCVMS
jgi:hypothetical protein